MENIINILLYNCDKKNTRTILSLSNVCKSYHNILNSIAINIVKSYYIENIPHNLHKIQFNILFIYYLSWCNIKDITFLEQLQTQEIEKQTNKFILNKLHLKLNTGRFEKYKRLQSPLYYYDLIHVIYNNTVQNSNNMQNNNSQNSHNILMLRLGCSCKIINNNIICIITDYYITFKESLVINIEHNMHLLILKHFLIFCEPHYAKSIYELKCNKLVDYDTRRLLDMYLHKTKLICQLRYKHGIIL